MIAIFNSLGGHELNLEEGKEITHFLLKHAIERAFNGPGSNCFIVEKAIFDGQDFTVFYTLDTGSLIVPCPASPGTVKFKEFCQSAANLNFSIKLI
jgi:hypothetical protein